MAEPLLDAVVGNLAILHFGRPAHAVAEFARVLKPGGTLAQSTWDKPSVARMPGIFFEAIQAAGAIAPSSIPFGPPVFHYADEDEFTDLPRGAGLHAVSVKTVAFSHLFPSTQEVWHWLIEGTVRAGVMVSGQPRETQARIHDELERLAGEFRDGPTGALTIPISIEVAHGLR